MGLFLSAAGIAGATPDDAERVLRDYATSRNGRFAPCGDGGSERDTLVMAERGGGKVSIVFPSEFYEWDEASAAMSAALDSPVFSFHIHDGDLWMYRLFVDGAEVDRFNPLPEYWGELDESERRSWAGSADLIARYWDGVSPARVARYLVPWDPSQTVRAKAYPDDEYAIGQDWQLVDFMKSLGLSWPEGADTVHRRTFLFQMPERPDARTVPAAPRRPWWRLW